MQGLSEVCQYPRCAKKAMFCCSKCLKRTYCSERCQILDWDEHKSHCMQNESKDQIISDISSAKELYGSALGVPLVDKPEKRSGDKKSKKPNSKKRKVEIEYNGSLLPHCLETVNNSIIRFFESMETTTQYATYFSKKENELYHTSSVSETVEVLQSVIDHLAKEEENKSLNEITVSESLKEMVQILIKLAEHFKKEELVNDFKAIDLYASWNDYKCTEESRRFCTHCGDKQDLVEHPKMNYVYLCKSCLENYEKNEWTKEDDHDMECYCCGDGGNVVLCDNCSHSICSNCIMLHLGVDEWEHVLNEESWLCLMCKKDENGKRIFEKPKK